MRKISILVIIVISSYCLHADVTLPKIFNDNMVLQRDRTIPVWGWANPNEKITVQFNHQTKKTKADKSGKWMIKLDSESAGGPYQGSDKVFACASQYILAGPTMPEMTTYITKRVFLLRHSEQMIGKG